MPLIIITGLPCSGKTHRAQQLVTEFTSRLSSDSSTSSFPSRLRILHIQSYHSSADSKSSLAGADLRDHTYNSAKEEKTARAEEFSAIKRALSRDVLVIADSLNYIKGYRYQLWCEAKAVGTRCCVVHVAAREDECQVWNNERLSAAGRAKEVEGEVQSQPKAMKQAPVEMLPESHTAIYGDRVVPSTSRSRSSSMGAESDNDEEQSSRAEDTMTLKSLYIHDRPGIAQYEEKVEKPSPASNPQTQRDLISTEPMPKASTTPPPPVSSPPYSPKTLNSLCMRYEPPSPFSRWDTPLFTIPTSDPHPPYTLIWASLFPPPTIRPSKKALAQQHASQPRRDETAAITATTTPAVKPHAATVLPPRSPATALQILESTTQLVTTTILTAYRSSPLFSNDGSLDHDGGPLRFRISSATSSSAASLSGSKTEAEPKAEVEMEEEEYEIMLPPGLALSQPMLQRLRRKYTGLQRGGIAHGVVGSGVSGGRKGVVEGFVRFLADEWGGGG